jgi:hypothetical protein
VYFVRDVSVWHLLLRALKKTLLVDLEGFEPSTSSVRLKRAPNCATGPCQANAIVSE